MKPPMLSINQVCERTSLGQSTVRQLIKSGALPAARFANVWRIDPEDLERFIASRKTSPSTVAAAADRVFDADMALPVEEREMFR